MNIVIDNQIQGISDLIKKISLDLIEGKVVIVDFNDCKFKTKNPKIVSISK